MCRLPCDADVNPEKVHAGVRNRGFRILKDAFVSTRDVTDLGKGEQKGHVGLNALLLQDLASADALPSRCNLIHHSTHTHLGPNAVTSTELCRM